MQSLWAPYKPRRYYFELVECGRRIALTVLAVFLLPGSAAQVAIEVVFAAVFIGVSDTLSPFADPLDAWLYRCGTWVIFFSMYLALLLKVDASDEESQSQVVFARVLIAAHVGLVLMVVSQAVLSFRRGLVAMRVLLPCETSRFSPNTIFDEMRLMMLLSQMNQNVQQVVEISRRSRYKRQAFFIVVAADTLPRSIDKYYGSISPRTRLVPNFEEWVDRC